MSTERKAIGAWFKAHRDNLGMTQTEVGNLIGKGFSTVAALENRGVTYQTAKNYAKNLGWELPELSEILREHRTSEPLQSTEFLTIPYLQLPNDSEMTNHAQQLFIPPERLHALLPSVDPEKLAFRHAPAQWLSDSVSAGDTLLADKAATSFNGNGIYAFTYKGLTTVRRLKQSTEGLQVMEDTGQDFLIPTQDIGAITFHAKILGKFIEFQAL